MVAMRGRESEVGLACAGFRFIFFNARRAAVLISWPSDDAWKSLRSSRWNALGSYSHPIQYVPFFCPDVMFT